MKLLFSVLFASLLLNSYAQTCSIKVEPDVSVQSFEEEMAVFFSLKFTINGVSFGTTSSRENLIRLNPNGFDTIRYVYFWQGKRIETFSLCKFRPNEHYTISPCTCCGIFLMLPGKKAERGFVQFVNESETPYLGSVSELGYDSIPAKDQTPFLFSAISMNCGFRPSQIAVFEQSYADTKYDYEQLSKLDDAVQSELEAEQRKLIRYEVDFLFLHGEKLILSISKDGSGFTLKTTLPPGK